MYDVSIRLSNFPITNKIDFILHVLYRMFLQSCVSLYLRPEYKSISPELHRAVSAYIGISRNASLCISGISVYRSQPISISASYRYHTISVLAYIDNSLYRTQSTV